MVTFFKYSSHVFFGLLVSLGLGWSLSAAYVQLEAYGFLLSIALLLVAAVLVAIARFKSRLFGWIGFAIAAGLVFLAYETLVVPAQDRNWALDVSRGVTARVEGELVTLSNIRDFDWSSETEATANWGTETYDLDQLSSVEMVTSVWDSPDIAHLLVSFGFESAEHIVFSVEIRREVHEKFNELGGFFRQFELVLIGARESDIIKLRTNYRKEDVSLFPVELTAEQRRTMFLSFVSLAQRLEKQPEFYNTVTANCTTVVYQLAKSLSSDLPLDWRLVLSGNLPEYLADMGVLGGEGSMVKRREEARISRVAQTAGSDTDFSKLIRSAAQ